MTSHRLVHASVHASVRASLRRALPAAALVLLAGGLAACTGDDPSEEPAADETSESVTPSGEPDATEPEETEETDEITPPGARLASDESALVNLPYPGSQDTSGVFRITLDAVETAPLSLLDRAGVPQPTEPSELYLVRQTFEMVDPGNDNPGLASLIDHTQMLDADGREADDINADLPGCEFDSFLESDRPGTERKACNAFVLPRSSPPVEVTYLTSDKEYDKLQGGDFIYWPVEGVTAS